MSGHADLAGQNMSTIHTTLQYVENVIVTVVMLDVTVTACDSILIESTSSALPTRLNTRTGLGHVLLAEGSAARTSVGVPEGSGMQS